MKFEAVPELKEYKRPMGHPADWTTRGFLAELMHRHELKTLYAVHKFLGVSRQTIYRYEEGNGFFSDEVAIRVAKALDIDADIVLVAVARERTSHVEAKKVWDTLAKKLAAAAVIAFVTVQIALFTPMEINPLIQEVAAAETSGEIYIIRIIVAAILLILWCKFRRPNNQ